MANWIYMLTSCHWAAICLTECVFFNKYWQNVLQILTECFSLLIWCIGRTANNASLNGLWPHVTLDENVLFIWERKKKKIFDQVSVTPMISCWFNGVAWHSFLETNPKASSPGGLDDWWCIGWYALTQGWVWGTCIYSTWRSCDTLWWKRTVFHWNTGPCNSLWPSELLRQRSATV